MLASVGQPKALPAEETAASIEQNTNTAAARAAKPGARASESTIWFDGTSILLRGGPYNAPDPVSRFAPGDVT